MINKFYSRLSCLLIRQTTIKFGSCNQIQKCRRSICTSAVTNINYSTTYFNKRTPRQEIVVKEFFNSGQKHKDAFLIGINAYSVDRSKRLKGSVDFIYAALSKMKEFGVQQDMEVYKALVEVLPAKLMVPSSVFHEMFMHYPLQQEVMVELLQQMESNLVIPDSELQHLLLERFGKKGAPALKMARMLYWMPKFKYRSPWLLPDELPTDAFQLAHLAIDRISSVDPSTNIQAYQTNELEDAAEDTWVISATSPTQQRLLTEHNIEEPIKVEGPFGVYLRQHIINYYILRGDPKPAPSKKSKREEDDVSNMYSWLEVDQKKESKTVKLKSIHEQDDGVFFGVCATGTSSRDSVLSWIRFLEMENPALADIPVLFAQSSPIGHVITAEDNQATNERRERTRQKKEKMKEQGSSEQTRQDSGEKET